MLERIGDILWGAPMCIAILGIGIYFTFKLRFIQIRGMIPAFRTLFKADGKGSISAAAALFTSLAAMLGTGNIVGVASAVHLGGAGAIFWMIVSSFFGMAISYVEGYLAIEYRRFEKDKVTGGAFLYIERAIGKAPAKFFAVCLMLSALFGIGTMTQSNSISLAFCDLYDFSGNKMIIAIVITLISGAILFGGLKRISGASTVIVPVMGSVYILGTLAVLFVFRARIPEVILKIFTSALDFKAISGGMVGAAIRYGISRGIFSNEAGLGTASVAAAVSRVNSPHEQGLCTMVGTFIDTTLLCTLTGLAILASGADLSLAGVELTNSAYNLGFPIMGKLIVSVSLILFALASIIGWSYYGEQASCYLVGNEGILPYRVVYLIAVFSGVFLSLTTVWQLADALNALLAIPNLIAIWVLRKNFSRKKGNLK